MSLRETILDTLESRFRDAITQSGYTGKIMQVIRWKENRLNTDNYSLPVVAILDTGRERVLVEDSTHKRLALDLEFHGFVQGTDVRGALSVCNEIAADIKRFLDSSPDLGDSVLRIRYQATDYHAAAENQAIAACLITARLTYGDTIPAVAAVTVVGDAFIDTVSDLLYARLAGTNLTRYQRHDLANMTVPSVSIGFDSAESSEVGLSTSLGIGYDLKFTIRVHAAYGDGWADQINIQSMLNSVINQIYNKVHLDVDNEWRVVSVSDIQTRVRFEESDTIGGQLTVAVNGYVEHTQE